jgi:hypothetical protein
MLLADAESCYSEEMAPASQSVTPSLSPSPPPPLPPQASTAARWTDLVPPHCQRCHLYTGSGNKGECVFFFLVCCGGFLKQWKSWDRPLVLAISLFGVSEADRPCVDTCVTLALSAARARFAAPLPPPIFPYKRPNWESNFGHVLVIVWLFNLLVY